MFFNCYPSGFLADSSNFGGFEGFSINHITGFGRNQPTQFHRLSHVRNMFTLGNSFILSGESNEQVPTCQICHKQGHIDDACWHKYGDNYLPLPKPFGRSKMIGSKAAYVANFEPNFK